MQYKIEAWSTLGTTGVLPTRITTPVCLGVPTLLHQAEPLMANDHR